MDDTSKPRCHSCGIQLTEEIYGTNADGTANSEFCKFCFRNGNQTNFALTLFEALDKAVENNIKDSSS
jgi:hypothetical protein